MVDLTVGNWRLYSAIAILAAFFWYIKSTKRPYKLLPGPRPLPFLGNIFDAPKEQEWLHWAKHRDQYGSLSMLSFMGQKVIVVNDLKAAIDLLEKRSSIYSDRPTFVFGGELAGWDRAVVLQQNDMRLRAYRRSIAHALGTKTAVNQFSGLLEAETRRFLLSVLEGQDERLSDSCRSLGGAITLRIAYGYKVNHAGHDPLLELSREALIQHGLCMIPGLWMVDTIRSLRYVPKWLPGASFKRTAEKFRETLDELAEKPLRFVQQQMRAGVAEPSHTSILLQSARDGIPDTKGSLNRNITEDEDTIKWTAASMYAAGADSTSSTIYTFYLAMLLHPDIMRKAQAEIDSVLGPDTLPTIADRERLPYVDALVKEVLRWHPVIPMGVPHATKQDDIYNGYLIPKGSVLWPNTWQLTHDPQYYCNPSAFDPTRFLPGGSGKDGEPEYDPHGIIFGFGRRICSGLVLADTIIFLAIASTLAVFDIQRAQDPTTGQEINTPCRFTSGLISQPEHFRCRISPRSARAESVVRAALEEHPNDSSDAELIGAIHWK